MNSHTRRRDDRPPPPDPAKQWVSADKYPPDYVSDRRRNRSATLPAHSYDPRSYPSHDPRYNDPRHTSRSHRQDPHHLPASSYSYHHSSVHPASTSKAYQHATRSSAQHPSSTPHHPQPSSYPHPTTTYPVAGSSRKPHPEAPDPRASRRPPYDQLHSADETPRASARPSRAVHSAIQPSISAPSNHAYWNPPQETSSSRRHKDTYGDPSRDQEREREREKERQRDRDPESRYKDKTRAERHRERERERTADVRYQDMSRSRHHEKRKDADTEGALYPEPRNASKASLSGREGYPSTVRELGNGHRRHRTEDGTASTGRRQQPENTHNPITTMPSHSTSAPQPDVQQTGEPPPPAPRVMPVHLPQKAKSQRSHRETRPSIAQGAQSGSDTERVTTKHRMERTPSGPAVQRSDAHTSTSTRDRGNHDPLMSSRDDVKRLESKYGVHQDTRQPLAPINVDIPLVTPGFNASALPTEIRASMVPQIVSIRAGQGPSDPHDAHFKSSAVSHSDALQEFAIHPHPTSASIVKSSGHTRPQSSETRVLSDRPPVVVEHSRIEPHGGDLPPGQRVSIHESSRALPTPISKPSYSRGNPETGVDIGSSSYPHSRPPSRSAHRTSTNNVVPPAVAGPRAQRSVSQQGSQTNGPPTRPPSVAHYSVPPSPTHPTNSSPPKVGHTHDSLSSAHPSPKYAQPHGVSPIPSTSTQQAPSVPLSAHAIHPTPPIAPQMLTTSSRPSTRDGTYADTSYPHQQLTDQQWTTNNNPEFRQTSNGTTVKASWVVQTPTTAKRAKISREDKYLRDPQAQLRQVLSQDDDPFPRASSSMMKASQAITSSASSQRSSFGAKSRDISFGTPRGTMTSNSPRSGSTKEAPTPEQVARQNLPLHLAPPQIAVVGATPVSMAPDLPQGRVDHAFLAPPFPAPARPSRTTSSSQDQQPRPSPPVVRNTSPTSYQPMPIPAVHAPSLFQPYQPPSSPAPEDVGQFSPPPLPIPPPRGPEDSPPPPIETRTSEIIRTRSQSDEHPQTYVDSIPEVQSEVFHVSSQPSAPPQLSSVLLPRVTEPWQPSKTNSNSIPTATSNGSAVVHDDARSSKPTFGQPDNVQVVHQDIMRATSVLPPQSSVPPTKPRPKVTVEDISEDSPVLGKGTSTSAPTIMASVLASRPAQPSQHNTVTNSNPMSSFIAADQPDSKSSPQSRSKDTFPNRNAELNAMPIAPPMPPPNLAAAPNATRVPSSGPPTQPTFPPSSQAAPAQRATTHSVPSRTYQRAAEMLLASKLSSPAGTNVGVTSTITGQHQPANGAGIHGPSTSRLVNAPTITAPYPSASGTASMTKVTLPTTTGSGPPVGAPGLHTSTLSTGSNIQASSALDPSKPQPGRPGPLSIPSLDVTSTTVMSTTAVKNTHQERPTVDSTRPPPSATRNLPSSSHIYPTSSRSGTSSAMTQQTHVPPTQPSTHYRAVSLPITQSSSGAQKPPSPRKHSQPISSTAASTQPFPSRPPAPEPQSARVPVSAHLSTPALVRPARLSPPNHTNDPDMLKTPSSIAPSPMLSPDTANIVPQSIAVPIRARKASTESKDDKKKGLFGLFRTRTLSSKAADPPPASSVNRTSADQGRSHPDASVAAASAPRGATSTPAPKELYPFPAPVASTSTRTGSHSQYKSKGRLDPTTIPPSTRATREHRDATPHMFTPFKFLTMHSKRNRTVSAASLDVCDGNTATNTVVGSPDHSTLSQAQPLPIIVPPDVRDPLVAASEWRDREEASRRERRTHRIRRPGVTFDLEEAPPSPAPGTSNKRKKLIRRPSGRTPTPGPPRG